MGGYHRKVLSQTNPIQAVQDPDQDGWRTPYQERPVHPLMPSQLGGQVGQPLLGLLFSSFEAPIDLYGLFGARPKALLRICQRGP